MTDSARERLVAQLQTLGFSGYESKAYVTLISAEGPLTGYEVGKNSSVPRSAVYEVLSSLVGKGIVFEIKVASGNAAYIALPPAALVSRLRREFDQSLLDVEAAIPQLQLPIQPSLSLHLHGIRAVRGRALDLVASSRDEMYLSVWPEDFAPLEEAAEGASRRGVDISMVAFGKVNPVGHTYIHAFSAPDVVLERVGCRLTVLAADRRAVLIAGAVGNDAWGVYSEDPAVVLVAVEFVRHDIAMQVLVDRLGRETVEGFWSTDPTLMRLATGKGAPGLPTSVQSQSKRLAERSR